MNMADVQGLSISATNEKEQSYSVDTVAVESLQLTVSVGPVSHSGKRQDKRRNYAQRFCERERV
ncbi:MAG: hypothetical protein L6V35_00600 [Alistipes putredinis]|nr:MAG: hypothetical protein L6V35_00600 [Alistipes putredinis]